MRPTPKVAFICTGNTCRSQMAEGWARALHGTRLEVWSAGVVPGRLDPRAVAVMKEAGVDISGQRSKGIAELPPGPFDAVVTVCAAAAASCPTLPGAGPRLHAAFDDPPRLAEGARTEDEALMPYRRVRDEIRAYVARLPERLEHLEVTR